MPTTTLMPLPKQQFLTNLGTPLAGGKVYTYAAGTSQRKETYTDPAGTKPQENPIPLNLRGEPESPIYWSGNYRVEVRSKLGYLIYTVDNFNTDPAELWNIRETILLNVTAATLKYFRPGSPQVIRTIQEKLSEFPSAADYGATSEGDATAPLQKFLDTGYGTLNDSSYSISAALKIPSLSHFAGSRAGTAFVGNVPTVKRAITKTTNSTVQIKNFQTQVETTVDCIIYTDPAWIDNGAAYPQKACIENMAFQGLASVPNGTGLYIEQGGGWTLRELDFSHVVNAIYAKDAWLTTVERVHAMGKIVWAGGTSVTFTNCWTGSGPGTDGGYVFSFLLYSTMNSCGSDGATNSAYRFVNSKLTLNGCGCENASTKTGNSGTAIAFDGGNQVVLNNFNCVPVANQVVPIYTAGFDNAVTFNQGCSQFGVPGVNCPDIYVWGNGSTVIFNDYVFLNGTKDNPVVQFATDVTTSVVIVRYGDNSKTYRSTGTGNTLIEAERDSGMFIPLLKFGGANVGMNAVASGNWQKNGKLITVSGRIALSEKGVSTGAASISGWPAGFIPLGDQDIGFSLVTGITGGPLAGIVDPGTAQAGIIVKSATGDATASDGNFTNTSSLRFSFSYTIA